MIKVISQTSPRFDCAAEFHLGIEKLLYEMGDNLVLAIGGCDLQCLSEYW